MSLDYRERKIIEFCFGIIIIVVLSYFLYKNTRVRDPWRPDPPTQVTVSDPNQSESSEDILPPPYPRTPTQDVKPLSLKSPFNQKWAILIGVEDYKDSDIPPAKYSSNDAFNLAITLEKHLGFKKDHIFLLCQKDIAFNISPNKTNSDEAIRKVTERIRPGDLFLFFFSGHGYSMGKSGLDIGVETTHYLLLENA